MLKYLLYLTLTMGFLPSGTAALAAGAAARDSSFVSSWEFFGRPGDDSGMTIEAYSAALKSLVTQFDDVCGDTFCGGAYSNIVSVSFDCSVAASTRQVGQCLWNFAGSETVIDQATGKITTASKIFSCDLGFKGTSHDLAGFLVKASATSTLAAGEGLTDVVVPGTQKSLFSTLADCL